jgi:ABC-type amino acid transport substrate-binding protein
MLFLISLAFANPIRVGVDESYPFSYQNNGQWTGVSVDLFQEIADQNDWDVRYVNVPTSGRMAAIDNGEIDVYLPAVTVTAARETKYDFSYTYFKDYLAITTHDSGSFWNYIKAFVAKSAGALKIMVPVLMLVAAIYYWFEKRSVYTTWQEEIREYFDSIYWAQTTAATVGYGDEAPKTIMGRATAIVWMLLGIMFFSWVVTQISSTSIPTSIDPSEMPDNLVAVRDTTGAQYLESLGVQYTLVENDEDLKAAYKAGSDICHDQSLITSMLPTANTLRIEDKPQYYGFLFPEDSPYIEGTDRGLLSVLESPTWRGIRAAHLKE